MDLTLVTSYDASPEEVFAMITDVTFQEQVFERLRARSYDVVVGDSGDDRAVRVHWQTQPVDVPVVARRLVGQSLVLAQNKIWHRPDVDGAREAEVDGEVAGAPVRLTGRTRIAPEGRGRPRPSSCTSPRRFRCGKGARAGCGGGGPGQAGEEVRGRVVLAGRLTLRSLWYGSSSDNGRTWTRVPVAAAWRTSSVTPAASVTVRVDASGSPDV